MKKEYLAAIVCVSALSAATFMPAPPANGRSAIAVAAMHDANGMGSKALSEYGEAIRRNPADVEARVRRATLNRDLNRIDSALNDVELALNHAPESVDLMLLHGDLLTKAGRDEEALRELDRAVALAPHAGQVYLQRGTWYARHERFEEAERDYSRAIQRSPGSWKAYEYRSVVRDHLGDEAGSVADFEASERLRN